MIQAHHGSNRVADANVPALLTLSRRRDLPPKVQGVLHGVFGLCVSKWPALVGATIREFEEQLFRHADKARSDSAQHEDFHSLRKVRTGGAEIIPRFLASLEDSFARFDRSGAPAKSHPAPGSATASPELSLVERVDLEESLAIQDLAVKADIRQTTALYMLGHRFGVLVAAPALDSTTLPIGPSRLGSALRHAIAPLGLSIEHRILLYQTFDRVAMNQAAAFYDTVNAYFVERHVLPHLRVHVNTPKGARAPADDATHGWHETKRAAHPSPGTHPAAAKTMPRQPVPPDERDSELFATLRELLAGRRHALGAAAGGPGVDDYVPSSADMQSVLGVLQAMPVPPAMVGGRVVPRAISQLRHDMLAHLRAFAPGGTTPQLAGEDSDTIDLVGMLFERIMQDIRPNSAAQTMLTRLQVPLLRVALGDKSFFTRRSHPARQLLNTIAETGSRWAEDGGEADRGLSEQMERVIDRVTAEYDGDLGLIEELLSDLSQHMRTLARKAEVSERRHVDAAKGRERLAVARQTARAAIATRIAALPPNPFLRTLLEQAWTDVLALTLLRHGDGSEQFRKQLDVVDRLLSNSASAKRGKVRPPSPALRARIASSLSEVGFDKADVQNVVRRLFTAAATEDEDDRPSRTELAMRLKRKPHLGTETEARHGAVKPPVKLELNTNEQAMVERLKTVPFGTWFELAVNQQGEHVRRKLSWYSPVTGHCLFVTPRGARAEERSLEQLARDLLRGQARFAKDEPESIVDRAWRAIVDSLRQLSGRGPREELVPA